MYCGSTLLHSLIHSQPKAMWVMYLQRTTHKKHENYNLDKPKKSLKMTRGFTSFIVFFFDFFRSTSKTNLRPANSHLY